MFRRAPRARPAAPRDYGFFEQRVGIEGLIVAKSGTASTALIGSATGCGSAAGDTSATGDSSATRGDSSATTAGISAVGISAACAAAVDPVPLAA